MKMRTFFWLALLLPKVVCGAPVSPTEPVLWTISATRVSDSAYVVLFKADIQQGWYLYSQFTDPNNGPLPTAFKFDEAPGLSVKTPLAENAKQKYEHAEELFQGAIVKKFSGWAAFSATVKTTATDGRLSGSVEFQTCDDNECLPPDIRYFQVDLATNTFKLSPVPLTKGASNALVAPAQEDEPVAWSLRCEKIDGGKWRFAFDAEVRDGWYVYSQESFGEGPIPTSILLDSAVTHAHFIGKLKESGPDMHEGMDEMFGINVRKYRRSVTFEQEVAVDDASRDIRGHVNFQACDETRCIFPDPLPFVVNLEKGTVTIGTKKMTPTGDCRYRISTVDLTTPVVKAKNEVNELHEGASLWRIFLLGFLGGLVALLTPCVFPMIPLTVSFFTKGSEDKAKGLRNALIYGAFILGIYLLFSLPFHLLGSVNADIFNEISTNQWLNIGFFVIFLVFAVSFFGYFEITLPSSWVNSMDQKASKFGGLVGIFFMALTLALVSFSCTGPILGSLLAGALTADGGAWQLTAGLGGFGLALALPFALFALFPSWLNSLPRSGSWLNSVKVVLGFAEIALAFKFLSNADLVKQWKIVPYELFMGIWVLCALGIVLYLFGLIRFPHDSKVTKRSATRWVFIGLFFATTVYLAFGLRVDQKKGTFTPMQLMSGLAPPVWYSWILPQKSEAFNDLDEALAYAKRIGKPVMIDFTGWACVNCRKMEEHVWPKDGVKEHIENDYVLVSLYVDDKRELPKEAQHIYTTCTGKQKQIQTYGNKWSTVQLETFAISSQPYYALVSPEGRLLTDPVGFTPDVEEYKAFLERGLQGMEKLRSEGK